jgi:hypothetical protein
MDRPRCSAQTFDDALVSCVLENQRRLGPKRLVKAANALQLDTRLAIEDDEVDDEDDE